MACPLLISVSILRTHYCQGEELQLALSIVCKGTIERLSERKPHFSLLFLLVYAIDVNQNDALGVDPATTAASCLIHCTTVRMY